MQSAYFSYILGQVLGCLIFHVQQQRVGTGLTQSGRDAVEAPASCQVQRCTPVQHAGIYAGTSLEQELHQASLLGFHSQMQGSLSTGALLCIDVSSILKQQFYEWLVPLQCGDVETGQTLPVLQLEVQGMRWLSARLWLLLQQAARTGQILALTGYMQGCVTVLVLQYSAGSLQHQGPDYIWLIQMNGQMQRCLVKVVLNIQDFLGQESQATE